MDGPEGGVVLQTLPRPQQVLEQLLVPEGLMGHVIGNGGSSFQAIESERGAKLSSAGKY